MGKKKNKNNAAVAAVGGEGKTLAENQQNNDNKKDDSSAAAAPEKTKTNTVLLKVDLHCEGCASKIVKCIRSFDGVEAVKCEWDASKLSVVGDVDPVKLREKIEQKTYKKVELISPVPKKENKENSDANTEKKPKDKDNKKNSKDSKENNKIPKEDKKPKEFPVTTAVLKVYLHCGGCIQKIQKIVTKTHGYQEMKIDKQKDLVTVTGAMDMKALAENLKKHLKKNVEIVPPKNDGEKKEKQKGGGGEEKAANGGGEMAASGGGMEGNKMMQMQVQYGYPYPPPYMYGPGPGYYGGEQYPVQYPYGSYHAPPPPPTHAPQYFSDENPNACVVM